MKIEIADRLKAFSHTPGHEVMIPGTRIRLKAFPSTLFFLDDEGSQIEILLRLEGPVDPFTVEQDLERREVRIYGEAVQGYFRLKVAAQNRSLVLRFEKTPDLGIYLGEKRFTSGDFLEVMKDILVFEGSINERLFLGSSKKKESDLIRRRKDLREVLPLWHRLGAITPCTDEGSFSLLDEAIEKKDKKRVYNLFFHAYLGYFSPGLVPREKDDERQGLPSLEGFSKSLLRRGSFSIRSLFFQEKEDRLYILPCLLPLFVYGKLIQVSTNGGCVLDIEWTKRRLRKLHVSVAKDQVLSLRFPPEVKSFRMKKSLKDRGKIFSGKVFEMSVREDDRLYFDLFKK